VRKVKGNSCWSIALRFYSKRGKESGRAREQGKNGELRAIFEVHARKRGKKKKKRKEY